jgi:hypothetical protein
MHTALPLFSKKFYIVGGEKLCLTPDYGSVVVLPWACSSIHSYTLEHAFQLICVEVVLLFTWVFLVLSCADI